MMLAASFSAPLEASEERHLRVTADDGVHLAGTIYLPEGIGPFPAVVFAHGSEPGTREMSGYRAWAEGFRARGLAALVFDKRGCGQSTGTYVEAPDLHDAASDLLLWVDLSTQRGEIANDAIGVLGWSQGGWVGPLAASRSDDIAFVVSISGPGVPPLEQNIYDKTNQFAARGASDERIETFRDVYRLVSTYLATGEGRDPASAAWVALEDSTWFQEGYQGPPMMDRDAVLADPRMTHYVAHSTYDPVPALERLRVPMLAVFGRDDPVVPVDASIAAMRAAFERSGNERLEIRVVPGADHGIRVRDEGGSLRPADGYPGFVIDWILASIDGSGPARR